MTTPKIDIPMDRLAELCKRWKIVELSLFGSVLRDDFDLESDVDVLVRYEDDSCHGFNDYLSMKEEFEALIGRPVDLVNRDNLENPFLRHEILNSRLEIYAA